jgi:hypothetical protein
LFLDLCLSEKFSAAVALPKCYQGGNLGPVRVTVWQLASGEGIR